jgi:D-alanyl-D-alanine carboxypeptidase/D-alanyl-D-alanine-endopeptidase (penicillin-binding protein 4)
MKKTFLLVFFVVFQGLALGQAGSLYFKSKLDSILKKPLFDSTQIALSVYDLTDGAPVFGKNEKMLLRPASTLKIITTAAALQFLKADYSFKTNLYVKGEIDDSTLTGDLFIEGGFDPELKTEDLDIFITALKKTGIKKIAGNIFADITKMDSLFWGKGWMWDDDSDRSFPYMNSLPVNKSCVKVITSPSSIGQAAVISTIPATGFVTIVNKSITSASDSSQIKIKRDWINRKNEITVNGFIGIGSKPDTSEVNVASPEKYFLTLFKEMLKKNNIEFNGKTDTLKIQSGARLISTVARPLTDIIYRANKDSDNLNAEMLLRTIAYEQLKRKITSADGIKFIDSLIVLTGMKKGNYRIVDGSGASFYNLVSTGLITDILKYIHGNPEMYRIISNSLPIAGVDGTLKERLKEFAHLQNIYAKTGTLSGTSNLAGYITTTHGHIMAFTLYIQNFTGSSKRVRDLQDDICRAIYLIKSDKEE